MATQYSGNAPLTWSKHSVVTIDGAVIDVWRVACDAPQYPTANRPAVIHVHGGGFISGGKEYEEFQNFQLTQQRHDWLQVSGIVCLYVSYRLAYDCKKRPAPDGTKTPASDGTEKPASDGTETPASNGTERPKISFPTPFTDVYSAILWAHNETQARMLRIDRANITVVGVSAGGCLAYQAAALARDENLNPPIARLNLMYPMLDPSQVKDGWKNHADFGIVIEGKPATWKTLLRMGWDAYLPLEPIDKAKYDKYAEYAEPLEIKAKGMLPTLLEVGDKDHFLEEDVELGEIMKKDGVPVKIVVYKGLAHDFERRPELLPWYSAWQLPYALSVRLAFLMKVDFKAPDVESKLKVGVAGTGGEISTN